MAKFDFSLIPEEDRPKPKTPPTEEERSKVINHTIEVLETELKELGRISTDREEDSFLRIQITMLRHVIKALKFDNEHSNSRSWS